MIFELLPAKVPLPGESKHRNLTVHTILDLIVGGGEEWAHFEK